VDEADFMPRLRKNENCLEMHPGNQSFVNRQGAGTFKLNCYVNGVSYKIDAAFKCLGSECLWKRVCSLVGP
jgi:hypothetical protein